MINKYNICILKEEVTRAIILTSLAYKALKYIVEETVILNIEIKGNRDKM